MGYGPVRWSFMESYLRAYRGLLRGEVVEWEGARMRMLHPDGHAPRRPVDIPILVGALGPKGAKVARELGDGLFATLQPPDFMTEHSCVAYLEWGTVLDEGEPTHSQHARETAGPGWALSFHSAYEFGGPEAVRTLAGGKEWAGGQRALTEGAEAPGSPLRTLCRAEPRGRAGLAGRGQRDTARGDLERAREQLRRKLDDYRARGVTEIVYQPCGPDVQRELERLLEVARAHES